MVHLLEQIHDGLCSPSQKCTQSLRVMEHFIVPNSLMSCVMTPRARAPTTQ